MPFFPFLTNGKLAWLNIPKNASTSMVEIFENQLGWQRQDLYRPTVDLDNLEFFGCLRDPDDRHTSGVAEYLHNHELTGVVADYPKLLAGGIFDQHTLPIHFMLPQAILDRCTFFVIDHPRSPWPDNFVSWLANRGIEFSGPIPRLNTSQERNDLLKQRIAEVKQKFRSYHIYLTKYVLAPDILLYQRHLEIQHKLADI